MYPARYLLGAPGVVLSVLLLLGGSASAQESGEREVRLTPSRDSGVSGTATFTDVGGGVEVELSMRGLPEAGVEHINHIHGGGTCAADRAGNTAPVTIPLNTLVAERDGAGSATTTLEDTTVQELFDGSEDRFVLLHAKTRRGQGVPPGIACADLVQTSGGASVQRAPGEEGDGTEQYEEGYSDHEEEEEYEGLETLPASGGVSPTALAALGLCATVALAAVALSALRRYGG